MLDFFAFILEAATNTGNKTGDIYRLSADGDVRLVPRFEMTGGDGTTVVTAAIEHATSASGPWFPLATATLNSGAPTSSNQTAVYPLPFIRTTVTRTGTAPTNWLGYVLLGSSSRLAATKVE
jgi:hypothetical protein